LRPVEEPDPGNRRAASGRLWPLRRHQNAGPRCRLVRRRGREKCLVSALRRAKYTDLLPAYNTVADIEGRARLANGGLKPAICQPRSPLDIGDGVVGRQQIGVLRPAQRRDQAFFPPTTADQSTTRACILMPPERPEAA